MLSDLFEGGAFLYDRVGRTSQRGARAGLATCRVAQATYPRKNNSANSPSSAGWFLWRAWAAPVPKSAPLSAWLSLAGKGEEGRGEGKDKGPWKLKSTLNPSTVKSELVSTTGKSLTISGTMGTLIFGSLPLIPYQRFVLVLMRRQRSSYSECYRPIPV